MPAPSLDGGAVIASKLALAARQFELVQTNGTLVVIG